MYVQQVLLSYCLTIESEEFIIFCIDYEALNNMPLVTEIRIKEHINSFFLHGVEKRELPKSIIVSNIRVKKTTVYNENMAGIVEVRIFFHSFQLQINFSRQKIVAINSYFLTVCL